jgi:glycerol-3-phosphate dehydrogenase
LHIHGFHAHAEQFGALSVYGADAVEIGKLAESSPAWQERLHPALPYVKAEVVWAVRQEMARTVEDVMARRTRALFLNARAALEMAPAVADLMAGELGWSETSKANQIEAFGNVAANYLIHA